MLVAKKYLKAMLSLSIAAYDSRLMPVGYADTARILVDPSVSRALFCGDHLDFGFVTRSEADGSVFVCLRGTESVFEWADDADAVLTLHPRTGKVHKGFWDVYTGMATCIREAVEQRWNERAGAVTVVGHSLGGALATLCAVDTAISGIGVNLVTFASPRVGDSVFARAVEAVTLTHIRVVNSRDIVTHIPCRPIYSHAGGTITFSGNSVNTVKAHSESLTYGPAIDVMPDAIQTQVNQG